MTGTTDTRITETLAFAQECLHDVSIAAASVGYDPMEIQLPPLLSPQPGAPPAISAEALGVFAAMYLESEIEQTGLISTTEILAAGRDRLAFNSVAAARRLDDFASPLHKYPARQARELIFARVFGTGQAAILERGNAINNGFEQLLANLCFALVQYSKDTNWNRPPNPAREAVVRRTATGLVLNLRARQFGNTLAAGAHIANMMQKAVAILSDPAVLAYFQTRTLWDTLRHLLGDRVPDLGRLLTRGQNGMRLLRWIAGILPQLTDEFQMRSVLGPNEPQYLWAAQWLEATGLMPVARGRIV